jgi:eukaryotic-like serine/threonine-protein kinase
MKNDGPLTEGPKPEEKEQGTVASVLPIPPEEQKEAFSPSPKSNPSEAKPDTGGIKSKITNTGRQDKINIDPDYQFGSGAQVGEYIAEEKIGEGGMGEVWVGNHPVIGKRVAIKLLNRDFINNKEVVARFVQEARAVNAIKHRGLVDIFSFGDLPDGRPYFVMEFLDGKPLSKYIKTRGPLPFGEIVDLFGQACRALQAAHDMGIIHRDLKPDNLYLILEEGANPFLKVLDFGIAKLAGTGGGPEAQHLTKTGAIFGTPAYMSPEQCEGAKAVDHRSDVYALGIILFEMITGRTPFSEPGDGIGTIMMKQMSLPAPVPSSVVSGRQIPQSVDELVIRVLSKNPEDRPPRCIELFEEIKKAVGALKSEELEDIKGAKPTFGPKQNIGEQMRRAHTTGANIVAVPNTGEPASQSHVGDYFAGSKTGASLPVIPPARRKGPIIGIAAVSVIAATAVVFFALDRQKNEPPKDKSNLVTVANNPEPTEVNPPVEVKTPVKPEKVKLLLAIKETGAKVFVDGNLIGETPLGNITTIPYKESEVVLKIDKDGFEPFIQNILPNVDIVATPELVKKGKAVIAGTDKPKNPKEPKPPKDPKNPKEPAVTKVEPKDPVIKVEPKDPVIKTADPDGTLNPFNKKQKP